MEQKIRTGTKPIVKQLMINGKRTSCPAEFDGKEKTLFRITRHKKTWRASKQVATPSKKSV